MDLKEFVSLTLTQIVEGAVAASARVAELGGAVSPAYTTSDNSEHMGSTLDGEHRPVHAVRFDVALTASTESTMQAGGGLKIAVASIGGKTEGSDRKESTSRVQFMVPLKLPTDPASSAAASAERNRQKQALAVARQRHRRI